MATENFLLRVYDIQTGQCFVSAIPAQHHKGPINCVKYAATGKCYATGGSDGAIKIWVYIRKVCLFISNESLNFDSGWREWALYKYVH